MENTYNRNKPNLEYIRKKWQNKICPEDKGGSFNTALYDDYLHAINNQPQNYDRISPKKA